MTVHTVNINEAQSNLAELIERVKSGEKVVIAQSDQSQVQLVVCESPVSKRVAGLHQGKVHLSDDFNDSLDETTWLGDH
jgi:antitoxin (DNA-binding transcriptional repressor) of toxin-antitoxin stability system